MAQIIFDVSKLRKAHADWMDAMDLHLDNRCLNCREIIIDGEKHKCPTIIDCVATDVLPELPAKTSNA